MFFMGEKKLGKIPVSPEEHAIYMLCVRTNCNLKPADVRAMDWDDRKWLQIYYFSIEAAQSELRRRRGNK